MFWVENVWHVCIVERTVGKTTVGPSEEVMRGSLAEWSWRWKIPPPSVCGLCLLRQAHLSGWRSWAQLLVIVSDFLGQNSLLWNYFLPSHSLFILLIQIFFSSVYKQMGRHWSDWDFPPLFCSYTLPFSHSTSVSLRRHLRDLYLSVLPHIFSGFILLSMG